MDFHEEEIIEGETPVVEVMYSPRYGIDATKVLADPFKIRFVMQKQDTTLKVVSPGSSPGKDVEEDPCYETPKVTRDGLNYKIRVEGGVGTRPLRASLITDDTFDGTVELILVNQTNHTRNMRINGCSGCFQIKPEVLRNPSNGWIQHGCLLVEAEIRLYVKSEELWTPKPVLGDNMRRLLMSGTGADIVFRVGEDTFPAHTCIVGLSSPVLGIATLNDNVDYGTPDEREEVVLKDINSAVFKELLVFMYTDTPTDMNVWKHYTLELLEAADRYHVHRLKLLAELELCRGGVPLHKVAELLVFAESHSCPQLKETCLELWAENSTAIMESQSWGIVSEAPELLSELLVALNTKLTGTTVLQQPYVCEPSSQSSKSIHSVSPAISPSSAAGGGSLSGLGPALSSKSQSPSRREPGHDSRELYQRRLRAMRVGELRRALSMSGLGVDGPREVLENRLLDRAYAG